ncbi:MAG: DapH/DapD/GlmU-related protein [Pseudomonadota bacterium]
MDIDPSAWIAETAYIDRTHPKGVHVAADCVIDEQAIVLTHDMIRSLKVDTRIGRGTTIGARAIVMPGVTIGENCDIRPGAIVTKDVADGTTLQGNPGRPL